MCLFFFFFAEGKLRSIEGKGSYDEGERLVTCPNDTDRKWWSRRTPSSVISPQAHTLTRVQPGCCLQGACRGAQLFLPGCGVGWPREQAGWAPEAGLGVHREGSSQRMASIPDRAWIWGRRTVPQQSPRGSWESGLEKLNPTAKAEGKARSSAWLGAGSLGMPEHPGVSLDGSGQARCDWVSGAHWECTAWSCYWLCASRPTHPILGCAAQSPGLSSWLCRRLGFSPCTLPTQVQCL